MWCRKCRSGPTVKVHSRAPENLYLCSDSTGIAECRARSVAGIEPAASSSRTQRTTGQQPQVMAFVLVSGLRGLTVAASEAV
jgi:hypothetical protein